MGRGKSARKTVTRSETVSVRLEPKLRYLADLAARRQRRSLSSFIEWSVVNALSQCPAADGFRSFADYASFLWDVDEAERFVKLALLFEDLLNHDEQLVWKVIKSNRYFWKKETGWLPILLEKASEEGSRKSQDGGISPCPDIPKIQKHWNLILDVAHGRASAHALPAAEQPSEQPKPVSKKPRPNVKEG